MGRTAIVVGGGIAGLSAGIALRKAGYDVTLYERAPKLEPIGAALSIWGNAMAGLDWFGCGDAVREQAHSMSNLKLTRANGRRLWGPVDISASDSWLPMRSDLQAALLFALGAEHCRLGIHLDEVRETGGKVVAYTAGEAVAEADLAVVADGIWSPTGTALVDNPPKFCGYVGVFGVGRTDHGQEGTAEEIWSSRDRFGLFDASAERRYWFYMCPASGPDGIGELDHAAIMRRAAHFPERVTTAVAATDPASLITISISTRATPKRLGKGRVICIGDAAHAMEPNQGQGGCQGIEDAWALGVLAGRLAPEDILPQLQRLRLPRIRQAMFDSALVGRAAHSRSALMRATLRALFVATPRATARRQFLSRIAPPKDYS